MVLLTVITDAQEVDVMFYSLRSFWTTITSDNMEERLVFLIDKLGKDKALRFEYELSATSSSIQLIVAFTSMFVNRYPERFSSMRGRYHGGALMFEVHINYYRLFHDILEDGFIFLCTLPTFVLITIANKVGSSGILIRSYDVDFKIRRMQVLLTDAVEEKIDSIFQ